ncbi:N4-gp56 family major capsid protein [Neobacillus drentensis]|uniref:phage capsid protein n=1 Tax=Neobacillus drentensis TaxID=220684 RepID=UPI002FFF9786
MTEAAVHQDYDWEGTQTIKVYSIATSAMNDYTRSGTTRYGTPAELDDTVATYTLAKDRSFTFTIDKGNNMDSLMVREAGKALARQNDEVVVPELDIYRLSKWVAAAAANGGRPTAAAITAANAYVSFLAAQEYLDENKVPVEGRIAFVTPKFYNFIKQDPTFSKAADLTVQRLINGQVGDIDGVKIIKAPSTYFPTKTPFVLTHKSVMVAPKKLQDYKIHDNPPGISGALCEGRIYYDAFVLDAKKKGVYAWLEV